MPAFALAGGGALGCCGPLDPWLDHQTLRGGDDEAPDGGFRRTQQGQHFAVNGLCQALEAAAFGDPDHGIESGHDGEERIALVLDVGGQAHRHLLEHNQNICQVYNRGGDSILLRAVQIHA